MYDDTDLPPPPPAYSEQEFDRKVSTAVEVSLTFSQPPVEDEWEVWDEALFEAAAHDTTRHHDGRRSGDHAGPSTGQRDGSVAPLRVHKKNPSDSKSRPAWHEEVSYGEGSSSSSHGHAGSSLITSSTNGSEARTSGKQRPSWYNEAGLGEASSPLQSNAAGSAQSRNPTSSGSSSLPSPTVSPSQGTNARTEVPVEASIPPDNQHEVGDDHESDEEDRSAPPPPFTPVGPSLDGPPFEEVASLSYTASSSTPPSPLASPPTPISQLPPHNRADHRQTYQESPSNLQQQPRTPSRASATRMSMPMPSVNNAAPAPRVRPTTAVPPPRRLQPNQGPQIEFNPYTAYGRRNDLMSRTPPAQVIDASAFYNSAVSAHIASPRRYPNQRPQTMEGRQYSNDHNAPQPSYMGARVASNAYNAWTPQPVAPNPSYPAQFAPQFTNQQTPQYGPAVSGGYQRMKQDQWGQPYPGL
ncbi:hypothetical protein PC9H_004919 [Pleurotus ostreatus]|uniref:Uncharacterized protein n=1 Tax=Pleurotus ostreatus TaxID=5322 RepID=A0A8H6ZVL4_PLEOS|nr:uncharacterized protein PC9H_004919 [Pleurotus ostreatus]KAF7432975.1 hypothetical protein PC9H_004919 [Pleurotus ostreatus]